MGRILWDDDPADGFVLEPAVRLDETLRTVGRMRTATSVAELESGPLPNWAAQVVAHHRDDADGDPATVGWDWGEMGEVVTDVVPLPWDARSLAAWLPPDLFARHVAASGASVGGHSDGYMIDDRDGLLAALAKRGHELERRPGLVATFQQAL